MKPVRLYVALFKLVGRQFPTIRFINAKGRPDGILVHLFIRINAAQRKLRFMVR